MKKYIIAFTAIFLFFIEEINAQDSLLKTNTVLICPIGLVAGHYKKLRVRVQNESWNHFAYGADFKYYFSNEYPGFQIGPYLKYFPARKPAHGVYFYATGVYGKNKGMPDDKSIYYDCYGGGAGIGFQVIFGKQRRGVFDFAGGLKYVETNNEVMSGRYVSGDNSDYYYIGPAALYDGIIALGFKF